MTRSRLVDRLLAEEDALPGPPRRWEARIGIREDDGSVGQVLVEAPEPGEAREPGAYRTAPTQEQEDARGAAVAMRAILANREGVSPDEPSAAEETPPWRPPPHPGARHSGGYSSSNRVRV